MWTAPTPSRTRPHPPVAPPRQARERGPGPGLTEGRGERAGLQETRKQAEEYLRQAAGQPGHCLNLLQLLATPGVDATVAQAGAVTFKNFVKKRWAPEEGGLGQALPPVPDAEKQQVRDHLASLMLSSSDRVQAQLSEALSLIAETDVPERWPGRLPELVGKFGSGDLRTINGVLATANSIFHHFRTEMDVFNLEVKAELKYVLDTFCGTEGAKPFLGLFQQLRPLVERSQGDAATLALALRAVELACQIFQSLTGSVHGLPEVFEDDLALWMDEFHFYLGYDNPLVTEADPEAPTLVSRVKAAVCDDLNLFIERHEEEFQEFLTGSPRVKYSFALDVWNLLTTLTLGANQDEVVRAAIRFLTTVGKSVHHTKVFGTDESLVQLIEKVALPNMQVRDEDEELFDMNFVEYVRRDMEGSDTDTRRRSACELVKAITSKFPEKVTAICSNYVNVLLGQYNQDPANNWKSKDCVLYLVMALTVVGKTEAKGATATNSLINIVDFFNTHIAPELQAPNVNDRPMLKADALKFLITFRSQIPKATCAGLMGDIVRLLGSESNVVHSYAAICVERMLTQRDGPARRYAPADLGSVIQPLLTALFGAFNHPESETNEYVMKCVMRVVAFLERQVAGIAAMCMEPLAQKLLAVCSNPVNSNFNHFAFETVAALIKYGSGDPATQGKFEAALFPVVEVVLQQDIEDFAPYVFQVMALLVEMHAAALPEVYMAMFQPILSPVLWERTGNVPGLVRLLWAYLKKAAISGDQVKGVLGVFQKLISSKAHDHQGFFILNTLVEHIPDALNEHYGTIWQLLLTRLQSSNTPKYTRSFVVFLCFFACKQTPQKLVDILEKLQPGMLGMLIQQVVVPKLSTVEGGLEEKVCTVGLTRVLCEVPALSQNQALWAQLLTALLTYLEVEHPEQPAPSADEVDMTYSAAYAALHYARRPEEDPVPEIKSHKQYLATAVGQLGAVPLEPAAQQVLVKYSQMQPVA